MGFNFGDVQASEHLVSQSGESVACTYNASDQSDARFHRNAKFGRMFRARSINPFEGGRWRFTVRTAGTLGRKKAFHNQVFSVFLWNRISIDLYSARVNAK